MCFSVFVSSPPILALLCIHFSRAVLNRYNRLERIKQLRWDFGSVLTPEIKYQLSESEVQWFNSYNKCLAGYMRSLGSQGGLDLTQDVKPPRTLYVEAISVPPHKFTNMQVDMFKLILLTGSLFG